MTVSAFHAQRDRAESFGAVAEAYDRYRPGYPDELIDALVGLRPAAVLDVGCGTGKAARQLAARGLAVLGVEIDAQMAAVARSHGIEVEVASFEAWDHRGRTFDLIVSGQAWHWVDPAVGAPKAVRMLRPGGTACFFWNDDGLADADQKAVNTVFRQLAPELLDDDRAGPDDSHAEQLRRTGCFGSVTTQRYEWRGTLPVGEWIGRMSTYSRSLLLGAQRLAQLGDALGAVLDDHVRLAGSTYVVWARP